MIYVTVTTQYSMKMEMDAIGTIKLLVHADNTILMNLLQLISAVLADLTKLLKFQSNGLILKHAKMITQPKINIMILAFGTIET